MAVRKKIDRRRSKKKSTQATKVQAKEPETPAPPVAERLDFSEASTRTEEEAVKPKASSSKRGRKKSEYLLKQRPKSEPKTKATKKRAPLSDEESYNHQEEELESSEHEESSSEEYQDESESEDESDEDEIFDANPKRSAGRKRTSRQGLGRSRNDELDETPVTKKRGKRKRPAATRRSVRGTDHENEAFLQDSETDESDAPDSARRRSTPSRASAATANARMARMDKDDTADEDQILKRPKRRRQDGTEDEEFDQNEEWEEDDESELDDEASEELSVSDARRGNVDNEDFFDTDSSNGDEAVGPSPTLKIRSTSRVTTGARRQHLFDDEAEESEEEASLSGVGGGELPHSQSSGPSLPDCPSTEDAVTMEELPKRHICYFTPKQTSCQCFALGTLHRIAMTSSVRDDSGNFVFLQPPHFRTPMSDDLIDQIACRFGRAALDLQGEYYRRGRNGKKESAQSSTNDELDENAFQQRLDRYIRNCMGSQDIYCCPVCYVEAHRRLTSLTADGEYEVEDDDPAEDENEDDDEVQGISLWHDPMTVLGVLDSESLKLAASFCFRKGVEAKRHLVDDHSIDPSNLDGYGLFQRFKIRDGDGLLQHFIEKNFKGHTYQGDMQRYWNAGNRQLFLYLLYLMHRHQSIKHQLEAEPESDIVSDKDKARITNARDYFDSFPIRAIHSWKTLSAPFTKATKEDLKDFVVDGDVEEDEQPHFALAFEKEMVSEEQMVQQMREERRRRGDASEDEDSSEEESDKEEESDSSDTSDDNKQAYPPGYYSEEEEEDDWVKSRKPNLKKKTPGTSTPKSASSRKRLRKGSNENGGNLVTVETPRERAPVVKEPTSSVRKLVIEDSDSD